MPPQLDLTGRRFGRLIVLSKGPTVKWGKWQASWACRCDCGALLDVPQNRLPHRQSIPASHRIDACDDCRSHPCEICGRPIPPRSASATCSPECHRERSRRYQLAYWNANKRDDPAVRLARTARAKANYAAMSQEERKESNRRRHQRTAEKFSRDEINAKARAWYAERMRDPEFREKRRQKSERWRNDNLDEVRRDQRDYRRRQRETGVARQVAIILDKKDDET